MAASTQSTGHLADVALGLASGPIWGLTEQGFETAELVFFFMHLDMLGFTWTKRHGGFNRGLTQRNKGKPGN